jgi:Spy/CpxP family protein refolding chaperone
MKKMRWQILVAMVVVFIAGAVIGVVGRVQAVVPGHQPDRRGSWLVSELGLSSEQSEKMKQIWSGVMSTAGKEHRERREALYEQHQSNLRTLLNEDQQRQYDALRAQLETELEQLDQQRRQAFEDAVEQTRQILTPEQREKYEQVLKDRVERQDRRRFGDGASRPSTRPMRDSTEHPATS